MLSTLVFATNNQHKLEEVRAIIGSRFEVKSLDDIGCEDDIPETGTTFNENALIKSRFVFEKYQIDCFSDDSGLMIDALNGEPGVHSARYSGKRDPEINLQLVLDKMNGISNRKAAFVTVISLLLNGKEYLFEGKIDGAIRTSRFGKAGFGYDPIFQPDGYAETFAEMPLELKNKISHRGIAVEKFSAFLNQNLV